jgi:maleamate amidohydrolase
VLVGATTSGCIRATAIDGIQYGYRVVIPREGVGDRARLTHEVNLFDIDGKYGDVTSLAVVLQHLARPLSTPLERRIKGISGP